MKLPVFGLHVGNTTASLAIYKEDGKIDVISNEIGDRVTPAVVSILNNEKLVGSVAKSMSIQKFNCTVIENKRLMNRSLSDTEKEEAIRKYRVGIEDVNGKLCYSIPFGEKVEKYTPAQIATLIYKKLYDIAKSAVHAAEGDTISCVILVPTYFDFDSIDYTKDAVKNAGWNILQIIKEPVAPILAYSLLEMKTIPKKIDFGGLSLPGETLVMVYRLGGVSCEATVLKIFSGMVEILGTSYKDNTGADHLILPLTNYLAQEFNRKYKLDPLESNKSMGKLKQVAETCMHSLSNLNNANCFVESLYEGVDFKHSVSRARLETYLSPLLSIYAEPIHDVLQKTKLSTDAIQKVILCGGLMKIPKLKSHIAGIFASAEVLNGLAPDEVLAYGAAQQAGYILSSKCNFSESKDPKTGDLVLPVTHSFQLTDQLIEVKITNYCNKNVQFKRYTVIPCHEKVCIDNVTSEGENQTFLFEVVIEGEVKLKGEEIVAPEKNVGYEIDVSITVRKKIEVRFTTRNLVLNKRQTKTVLLNPVSTLD